MMLLHVTPKSLKKLKDVLLFLDNGESFTDDRKITNFLTAEPFRILEIFLLCLYVFQFLLLEFVIWKIWSYNHNKSNAK